MGQTLNFDRWVMYGSGWEVSFTAQAENISVSRAYGSNQATVTCKARIKSVGGSTNTTAKFWIKIAGTWYSIIIPGDQKNGNYYTYWAGVQYSANFSQSIQVGATGGTLSGQVCFGTDDINGPHAESAYKDWSQTYGTKGASTIASAGNVSFGTGTSATSTVTFTSYSSSFTHKIKATLGSASTSEVSVDGGDNVSKSGTLTFGTAFINAIPNAKKGTATVYLYTYSGSTLIGTNTKSITVTVPTNISPTISSVAGAKVSTLSSTYFSGKICTLIDKLKITWSESLKYGATVSSREITAIGKTYNSASDFTTTNALTTAGANSISVKINDSRGNSGIATSSIDVYNYFYPSVDVKYSHSESNYKLIINCRIAYVGNAQTTKQLRLAIYKGETAVSGYTNINLDSAISSVVGDTNYTKYYDVNNYEYTIPTAAIIDIETETYKFVVTATDTVTSSTAQVYSGIPVMSLKAGGTGITMHKPVQFLADAFDKNGNEIDFSYLLENAGAIDQNIAVVPTLLGQITVDAGQNAQGMTTDGTYLYMATIDNSDGVSNPKIHQVNRTTLEEITNSPKTPPKKGHYNNLNYYGGYIYATGFNTQDINDDYSQIYKYNYSNNTGSVITTKEWYWNFAIGEMTYDNVSPEPKFYVGHIASRNAFNVFTEVVIGSNRFYPFTMSPTEFYNGVEQGCAIYDNKFVCTILSDPRSFGSPIHGANEILITNLTGETIKRISLKTEYYEELEDICFIGNKAYINAASGRIYTIEDITTLIRGFYESRFPVVWKKPCWLYINANGTETYYTGTYGSSSGTLLKSFSLSPMTVTHHFTNASGLFALRGEFYPIKIDPSTRVLSVSASFTDGSYSYDVNLRYTRSSSSTHYTYTLSSIKGGYRNADGVVTSFNATTATAIQNVCNGVFYTGSSYVHSVIAETTAQYNNSAEVF